MSGNRYIVAKVSEEDLRTLIYEPDPAKRQVTIALDQHVADLDVKDLQSLGLWEQANNLAGDLAADRPPKCGAWFGARDTGGEYCLRAAEHPTITQDGIGHSASARYQYL